MGQSVNERLKSTLINLIPLGVLIAIFMLGFAGKPEDSPWLNSSQLWQKGDPFFWEGSRALASPYFLYRGRPHAEGEWPYYGVSNTYQHNELGLRDDPILDPKPDGVMRILNIGDSATWGLSLPARSDTYSDRLDEALNTSGSDTRSEKYDVVNAGTIGYSSWQASRWLAFYIDQLEPDIVTVYIGNNDSAPGGISDAKRGLVPFGALTRVLNNNAFYLLLQKAWLNLGKRARDQEREAFIASVSSKKRSMTKDEYYDSVARVSPSEYEGNLRAIIDIARQGGARVILLKVPMNFVWPQIVTPTRRHVFNREYWFPVYVAKNYMANGLKQQPTCRTPLLSHPWLCRVSSEQLSAYLKKHTPFRDAEEFVSKREALLAKADFDPIENPAAIHQLAIAYIAQEKPEKAVELLSSLTHSISLDSESTIPAQDRAQIEYALGMSHLLAGQQNEAEAAFVRSRETFPFATSYEYHDAFERVTQEQGVESIDLPRLFKDTDPEYFGSSLMHDWVHPTPAGNQVIADAIADLISETGHGQ
jgi:lysophospholipase L1-like esterase